MKKILNALKNYFGSLQLAFCCIIFDFCLIVSFFMNFILNLQEAHLSFSSLECIGYFGGFLYGFQIVFIIFYFSFQGVYVLFDFLFCFFKKIVK